MKTKLTSLALAAILSGQICLAQANEPVNDWKPAPSNQQGNQYPQLNSEGRVKFRIVAPEAKSVGCTFRDNSEFKKGDDGAWYGSCCPSRKSTARPRLARHSTRAPSAWTNCCCATSPPPCP
jgi:hypothetical protein